MKVKGNKIVYEEKDGLKLIFDRFNGIVVNKDNKPVSMEEAKKFAAKPEVLDSIENYVGSTFKMSFRSRDHEITRN